MTRKGTLLLQRYGYNAKVLPRVRIQRNFDLDSLLVTKPRKIERRNTASDIGQVTPKSILKRNDLPFTIRGRRKSVSFGTVDRRRFSADSPQLTYANDAPSMANHYAIPGPSNRLVHQVSDLVVQASNITLDSTAQPEASNGLQEDEENSVASTSMQANTLSDSLSPTITLTPFGTPKNYGKDSPRTPKNRLPKGTTVALILNRLNLESNKHNNDLLNTPSPEQIIDPLESNVDADFGFIIYDSDSD